LILVGKCPHSAAVFRFNMDYWIYSEAIIAQ
jgi:hypothetical protein